jgi:hypothetical protein
MSEVGTTWQALEFLWPVVRQGLIDSDKQYAGDVWLFSLSTSLGTSPGGS